MLQRITELWPQLLRGAGGQPEQEGESGSALYELNQLARRSIEESFASLSWSRVVSLAAPQDGDRREWPMVADIIEAREHVVDSPAAVPPEPPVLFDPKAFEGDREDLKVDTYALDAASLEQWALRAAKIRVSFKAYCAGLQEEVASPDSRAQGQPASQANPRSRRGLKHSTKAKHPEKKTEKELQRQARWEAGSPSKIKKRKLRELSVHEQAQIVEAYTKAFKYQRDVAAEFHVSCALVGRLVKKNQVDPFFLSRQLGKQQADRANTEATEHVVTEMLRASRPIENAKQVQAEVQKRFGLEVTPTQVKRTMKHTLNMSFRQAKKVPKQANTERCLVLRQQYAMEMLPLLEQKKRIVNVDESWLNESTFYRKLWAPKAAVNSVAARTVAPRLSLIAAIDTQGHVWFALTQANTDSNVLLAFFRALLQVMALESPGFEKDTVFLLDGARYHTSPEMRHFY